MGPKSALGHVAMTFIRTQWCPGAEFGSQYVIRKNSWQGTNKDTGLCLGKMEDSATHATVSELMHSLCHTLRRALTSLGTEVGECHLPLE